MQAFRKSFVMLVLVAVLAACAPQVSQGQVQSLVQTSVAATMDAQNQVSTFVAQTVQAQQPAATETNTPTVEVTASPLATLTPIITPIATSTSAPSYSGGSGGYVAPAAYSCDQIDWRPLDGTAFYPNQGFLIKWTLLNNGTQQWCNNNACSSSSGPDLTFDSGTDLTQGKFYGPVQVPPLKPGQTYVVPAISGRAPSKPGTYTMVWKLQGPICYPYITIVVK